jgi:hypothetical protein
MNFIEQCLGVSPDGGTGSLEAWCLATLVISMALFIVHRSVGASAGAGLGTRS